MVTRSPRACSNFASEAEIMPFPNDDVTPPETNTYFVAIVFRINDKVTQKSLMSKAMKSNIGLAHFAILHK
jgi:hypothetical protein